MLLEKKQQAKNLYFQSELTKTQIAELLQISRRSVTNWIKEGNWERLRHSADHLPSIIAENCYHIMGHLTEHHLSERRLTNPITPKEIDGLYKLSLTVNKVKNRSTLNESMEMFGFFMEGLRARNEKLANELAPYIDEYISSRAAIYTRHVAPAHFTGLGGRIPFPDTDRTEERLDARENFFSDPDIIAAYADAGIPFPSDEEICTLPDDTPFSAYKTEPEEDVPAPAPAAQPAQVLPQDNTKTTPPSDSKINKTPQAGPAGTKKIYEQLSAEDAALYARYLRMAADRGLELKTTAPQPS